MRSIALLVLTLLAAFESASGEIPAPDLVPTNALSFSGEPAQAVQVAGSAFNVTSGLTIEAWVHVTSWTKRYQAVVTKGDAWGIVRNDDKAQIAFRSAVSGTPNAFDDLVSTKDFPLSAWTHVAAVFTGTRKQLYFNGELVADAPYAGPLVTNNFPLTIGGNAAMTDRTLMGMIDSVRLWSVPRSAAQIKAYTHEYLRGSETGLLGDWRFNEAIGNVALDSSPAAAHGVIQIGKPASGTGVLPWRVAGLALNPASNGDFAIQLQNRTAQYPVFGGLPPVNTLQFVQFPEPGAPNFHFGSGMTAEAWIYPQAIPESGFVAVMSKGTGAWEVRYHHTGKISFVTAGVQTSVPGGDLTELISQTRVEIQKWTHVAVTWDATARKKSIYINGVLDTTVPADGILGQTNEPVVLGARPPVSAPTLGFFGAIDEVRLWRLVRTPGEILANHVLRLNGSEPGIAGFWSFNEADSPTSAEGSMRALPALLSAGMSSFNRVDGVVLGPPLLASYTLELNGSNQFATATADPALSNLTSLTLEAWIRPKAAPTAGYATIVQKGDAGYGLALDQNLHLRFIVGANALQAPRSDGVVPLDVWSHVAVVVNGATKTTTFYINGKAAGTVNSATIAESAGLLGIGKHGGAALSSFFHGAIDEIRIWNKARTPAEIILLAFGELPAAAPGLLAHYSFTEGRGHSAADGAFGRTATLFNTDDTSWFAGPIFPQAPTLPPGLNLTQNPKAAGLWVGDVTLRKVNEVQKAVNGAAEAVSPTGSTASIRIILHVDASGQVRLLKDVIVMQTQPAGVPPPPPKLVLVTDPTQIFQYEGVVKRNGKMVGLRYGTAAFDFPGIETTMIGGVGLGLACAGRIDLDKLAPTNPYRHKYHPDHKVGFDLIRVFSIQFSGAPGDPLTAAPAYGVDRITGTYRESIAGLHKITLKTEGTVTLNRISAIATLNTP